jgi:PAS domain S-box-containing protein
MNDLPTSALAPGDDLSCLSGGGQMGELIRSTDWSQTPLGPIQAWPQSLKTAAGIMLGAGTPISIGWGPDLILLYNDAWRASVGDKHPAALGRPAREVFAEMWEIIGPLVAGVMSGRGAAQAQRQQLPIYRYGRVEQSWVDYSFSPIRCADGSIGGVFNTTVEVTDQVQAEETLRETERKYRELVSHAPAGIYEVDFRRKRFNSVNDAMCDMLGYSREELLDLNPFDILDEEGQARFQARIARWLAGEEPGRNVEYKVTAKDGRVLDALLNVTFMADEQRAPLGATVVAHDITERKRVEQERERLLAEVERRAAEAEEGQRTLQALMEYVPEGITIADAPDVKLRIVSRYGTELLGGAHTEMTAEEVASQWTVTYADGETPMPGDELPLVRAIRRGEVVRDMELVQKNVRGERLWLLCNAGPIRDENSQVVGGIVAWRDITERKRAQEALRESEERLRLATEAADMYGWEIDMASQTFKWSETAAHGVDFRMPETLAEVWAVVHPDDLAQVMEAFQRAIERGGEFETEYRIANRAPDEEVWVYSAGVAIAGADGSPARVVGVTQNITGRKRLEEALAAERDLLELRVQERTEALVRANRELRREFAERERAELALQESEAHLRTIFESAAIGIAIVGESGRLIDSNAALQAILGYSVEELRGMSLHKFVHPEDRAVGTSCFRELLAGKRDSYRLEIRALHKDGSERWISLAVSSARGPDGQVDFMIGMVQDITRQKEIQEALVRSEKLALAATLTGSLAHEIKNPLQSIIGCVELASEAVRDGDDPSRFLEVAREELWRTVSLVDQLRDLYRPVAQNEQRVTDVNAVLERVLELNAQRCRDTGVEVTWRPAADLPWLVAAPGRLQQVFLNLLLNALDAMPEGGALHVRTEAGQAPDGVWVTFEDSGPGIAPEMLARLFEPFYTTKEAGLGLGLYICQNIIREHGGRIEVSSTIGRGARFAIWLPAGDPGALPT